MKLMDERGNVIQTMERAPNGAIIVRDESALNTYRNEVKRALEVNEMKDKIAKMEKLISQLLSK